MYTISRFSQLCKMSTRMLRHYDKEDLLKPAHVDTANGYRYYDKSQLETALQVKKLKEYGFSLPEIRTIIQTSDRNLFIEFVQLKIKELSCEVHQHLQVIAEMHEIIDRKTDWSAGEQRLYDILLGLRNEMAVISQRFHMNIADMDEHIDLLYDKAEENNIQLSGVPSAIFYDEEYDPDLSDIELMIPIIHVNNGDLSNEWKIKKLPPHLITTTLHIGSYDHIGYGHMALEEWINNNGYLIVGPPYETYLKGSECGCPVEEYVTQICFPVMQKARQ